MLRDSSIVSVNNNERNNLMSEQTSENPFFTTVFIGNRGAGKTSVLSAMYMALDEANLPCGLSLVPKTTDEFNLLKNKWREMNRFIRKQTFGVSIQKPLYHGSMGFTPHDFILTGDPSQKDDGLPIRIWDTAGGDTASVNQHLIDTVSQSFSGMGAVDATFLWECDSVVNEAMNEVCSIKQILKRALNNQESRVMAVFFLITKCEKYMQDDAKRQKLADKFNKEFHSVLEFLQQRRIAAHYMPVQTMGCVELARIEEEDDGTWNQYFQVIMGKEFDARDAVHPLSVLLQLCLQILDYATQTEWDKRTPWGKLKDWLMRRKRPVKLDPLVRAIADHFGAPKDWRTNRNGELAVVEPGFVSVTDTVK